MFTLSWPSATSWLRRSASQASLRLRRFSSSSCVRWAGDAAAISSAAGSCALDHLDQRELAAHFEDLRRAGAGRQREGEREQVLGRAQARHEAVGPALQAAGPLQRELRLPGRRLQALAAANGLREPIRGLLGLLARRLAAQDLARELSLHLVEGAQLRGLALLDPQQVESEIGADHRRQLAGLRARRRRPRTASPSGRA